LEICHVEQSVRRGRGRGRVASADVDRLASDLEWAVACKLLDLGDVVLRALDNNEPHVVSRYLLDVCALFSRWYTAGNQDRGLRVLVDDDRATSQARLCLVAAVETVLARGLALLGLEAPDVM